MQVVIPSLFTNLSLPEDIFNGLLGLFNICLKLGSPSLSLAAKQAACAALFNIAKHNNRLSDRWSILTDGVSLNIKGQEQPVYLSLWCIAGSRHAAALSALREEFLSKTREDASSLTANRCSIGLLGLLLPNVKMRLRVDRQEGVIRHLLDLNRLSKEIAVRVYFVVVVADVQKKLPLANGQMGMVVKYNYLHCIQLGEQKVVEGWREWRVHYRQAVKKVTDR